MNESGALLTDLYQLAMLQAYCDEGMREQAVFEFFVRTMPDERGYLLCAGLDPLLDYLEHCTPSQDELVWLASLKRFKPEFLDWLGELRFQGDVDALAEGTPFFASEPVLRISAPIAQAQWVESRLINLLHYQILIASKAARCVQAAPGKLLVDFGLRRAHGGEAGLLAARCCYLAGFAGTATVLAGLRYGVPLYGTMAHSYVLAHSHEIEAFERFAEQQRDNLVLLIDTYDTQAAAHSVVELAGKLAQRGIRIKAVRLDSGDLAEEARRVRAVFDAAGLNEIGIFCSGNLDEYELARLLSVAAPIDGFGIGTRLDTSSDVPYLDCAYKLQSYAGHARRKRSSGKANWPGAKQVFRRYDADGRMAGDTVALVGERPEGHMLLQPVMREGKRVVPERPLSELRDRTRAALATLPAPLLELRPCSLSYRVEISEAVRRLAAELDREKH
jgi:nicotinate phosphoribosyltransferase